MARAKTVYKTENESEDDLTGKQQLLKNTVVSWLAYLILLISGFVLPRLIDRQIGQAGLGTWDFAWSLVNYLGMSNLGIGSSVNRYVAKYRAAGQHDNIRYVVSSVAVIQVGIAVFVFVTTLFIAWCLPLFFGERFGNDVEVVRWIIALLGTALAVETAVDSSRGIMTGCHRWDLHNTINIGSRTIAVILMVAVLLAGGGLIGLAVVHFLTVCITERFRFLKAHRICPDAIISFSDARWDTGRKMLGFGIKHIIAGLPHLIVVQSFSLLVVANIGVTALAVLARPLALIRHVEVLVSRYTWVLTPIAGALQGSGKGSEINDFLLRNASYGVALTTPPVLFLSIYGDVLLKVWMGTDYAQGYLIVVLAAGALLPISQNPVLSTLIGINRHGRIGILNLVITIFITALAAIVLSMVGWTLSGASVAIAIATTIGSGIFVPLYGCRILQIPLFEYMRRVFTVPVACGAVFGIYLLLVRMLAGERELMGFIVGSVTAPAVLLILYWRYVFSDDLRNRITGVLKARLRRI